MPHGMEEGKGPRCLAPSRQYGNALLGVRHQEEEATDSDYQHVMLYGSQGNRSKLLMMSDAMS